MPVPKSLGLIYLLVPRNSVKWPVSQRAGGSDDAESKQRRQSYVRRMKSCNKTGGYLQWSHCTGGSGANRDGQLEESATCGTLDYISSNTPLERGLSSSSSSPPGGGSAQFAVCNSIIVRVRVSLKRSSFLVCALRRVRYSRMGGPNGLALNLSLGFQLWVELGISQFWFNRGLNCVVAFELLYYY